MMTREWARRTVSLYHMKCAPRAVQALRPVVWCLLSGPRRAFPHRYLHGHAHGDFDSKSQTLEQYARLREGSQTHYIAPTLEEAKRRIDEGFAFIGDTDQWDLSICLFHAMFGGKCLPVELHDMRPTHYDHGKASGVKGAKADDPAKQAEALRQVYVDPIDTAMYAHAMLRFEADLAKHRVSRALCAQLECTTPADSRRTLMPVGVRRERMNS